MTEKNYEKLLNFAIEMSSIDNFCEHMEIVAKLAQKVLSELDKREQA